MRELVLKMSMSIDGFVAATRVESDWMFRRGTADSAAWVTETLSGAGVHAMGRHMFEGGLGFWPGSPSPMARPMNEIPKVVFTRQPSYEPGALVTASGAAVGGEPAGADAASSAALSSAAQSSAALASWVGARVANGDLPAEIQGLKEEPGAYILAQGGVAFARDLVRSGLVDEYRFAVLPVALGSGAGLFVDLPGELDLELISSSVFRGGAMGNVYRPRRSARVDQPE